MIIQIFSQIPIILRRPKVETIYHKVPNHFHWKRKSFPTFLLISIRNTALKREQSETRLQEETHILKWPIKITWGRVLYSDSITIREFPAPSGISIFSILGNIWIEAFLLKGGFRVKVFILDRDELWFTIKGCNKYEQAAQRG
jgi:hypothetical protein